MQAASADPGSTVTLLDEDAQAHELPGQSTAVDADALAEATGWVPKAEGLCRGEVCVPLPGRRVDAGGGRTDLAEWAAALGLPLAVDAEHAVAALAPAPHQQGGVGQAAPDLDLPALDGTSRPFRHLADASGCW